MNERLEHWMLGVMSGRTRGVASSVTRAALACVEPAYAGVARVRNRLYARGSLNVRRLPRPVLSVGNLTTGGTGKTPAVQWIVRSLRARGRTPGVLLRGYRRDGLNAASDEEQLLRESLGCPVVADADRSRGGARLLADSPAVDVVVLDDGFQHRRLARDLDVVLIDATNPFGFGHVLPRGLLREPVGGVARAGLVIVTRTDLVDPTTLPSVETIVRSHHPTVPLVRSTHALTDLVAADGGVEGGLADRRVFALGGIGNPQAFTASLARAGANVVGARHFPDHHAYRDADATDAISRAVAAGAQAVATTEKDWVKLRALPAVIGSRLPVLRAGVQLHLTTTDEATALAVIDRALATADGKARLAQ